MKPDNTFYLPPAAILLAIILAAWLTPYTGHASDLEREKRLAEQTVDAILDGEPVMLKAGNHEFLGIYTEAETAVATGAAIILHGRGMHPDWAQVANPLRTGLPLDGWATLSLQMPVLPKEAKFYDYLPVLPEAVPRIDAGIRYLRELGFKKVVLISHSCGVHMAMTWIQHRGDDAIDAFIGIGMGATDYQQPMPEPFPFDRIQVPLLNIYGSNDYPAVHRMAADLRPGLNKINERSAQVEIAGADHYFDDYNDELVSAVLAWLNSLPTTGSMSPTRID